jgi:hypothetical protein
MKVNGAWYIDSLPTMIVIELETGHLKMFYLNPFKEIKESNLSAYKGYHPRKCKGQPLPSYLYKQYGLQKNEETATEVIHIRVTPREKEKIKNNADNSGTTISEYIREKILEA